MASIRPVGKDTLVLAVGAKHRFTFRTGALEMLLDPAPGMRVERVPLVRGVTDEVGEIALTPSRRSLVVRLRDPPRQYLAKAENALRLVRGELNALDLIDVSDPPNARTPPATARDARPAHATEPTEAPRTVRADAERASLDAVMRGVHACPSGLTCRPGGGQCYPAATMGRADGSAEVLLVGWNPRVTEYASGRMPEYDEWRDEFATALPRLARVDALLPDGAGIASGRVAGTFLWKWPTRLKSGSDGERFYADRCVRAHFADELSALAPRALVTFDAEAADYLAEDAARLGLEVRPAPVPLRNGEILGRVEPTLEWGWPMGLVLVRDPRDARYHPDTVRWAHIAIRKTLEEAAALDAEPYRA